MAYKNKRICNPKTGQSILFLQTAKDTNGSLLDMETTYQPHSIIPAGHYHPFQEEEFYVVKGELAVCTDGQMKLISEGQSICIAANSRHAMWNQSETETLVRWKVRPAMQTEYLLETMFGLAADNKTNDKGMPPFLQLIAIANHYTSVMRLSKPSYAVQKSLFSVLSLFARLFGYKSFYKKYID